jgi:hypothetical protein
VNAVEQIEVREVAPEAVPADEHPEIIALLGCAFLRFKQSESWFAERGGLDMQLSLHGDGKWWLNVRRWAASGRANGTHVECTAEAATPEACEREWLEVASLEAPRLCALVVDGMAVPS